MCRLPTAYSSSSFVKNSFVVSLPDFFAGLLSQQLPEGFVLVVDLQVFFLSRRSNLVCAKEKTIRVTINHRRGILSRFRRSHDVLRNFIPGDVEVDVAQFRLINDLLDDSGLLLDWPNNPPDADMGPDKRRIGMTPEQRLHLGRISRFGAGLCEWNVNVVVNQNDQACLGGEIDQAIERLVLKTRHLTRDLCGNKFFMNAEFPDAAEHTGKSLEHASNMIGGVHVRRIEPCDHWIEPKLLFL